MATQRGIENHQEQDPQRLLRDTRPASQQFTDFIGQPSNAAVGLFTLAGVAMFMPGLFDVAGAAGMGLYAYTLRRKSKLPFRMPLRARMPDPNDPLPGSHKPRQSRGIAYFGNQKRDGAELWFTNDDMRTHVLIFGSTGSGKTETLISLAFNALTYASGFIYVDGKGDSSLFAKVFSMVRRMGREDDLLVINYMTGARDIIGPQVDRLSNTMNPFSSGSSGMLSNLLVSLMDDGGDGGDMWKGRAISFVEALIRVLVFLRDRPDGGGPRITMDVHTIRSYFVLEELEKLCFEGMQQYGVSQEYVQVWDALVNYVVNLPGYDQKKRYKQAGEVREQHGFITMQLTRTFGSLADTYGHIVRTQQAEVDFEDIVLNRRILCVLLPALEKSPDELSNLGKVIIASLKAMMAKGLGSRLEGTLREVVESKPTNAPTPFICVLDEYGYYAVKGFAVVAAQARSLGFCAIFAGQDLPALRKIAGEEEAMSIGGNANIKIAMKLEDPMDTWEFFQKISGEAYVTHVSGFSSNANGLTNNYTDMQNASVEKRARIDLMDLKSQREGEAHIIFQDKIVRANMFYANPAMSGAMRLNHFLKVRLPAEDVVAGLDGSLSELIGRLGTPGFAAGLDAPTGTEVKHVASVFGAARAAHLKPLEAGLASLVLYRDRLQAGVQAFTAAFEQNQAATATPPVATPITTTDPDDDLSSFDVFDDMLGPVPSSPVLDLGEVVTLAQPVALDARATRLGIDSIEQAMGVAPEVASETAAEVVQSMQAQTQYPTPPYPASDGADELVAALAELTAELTAHAGADGES